MSLRLDILETFVLGLAKKEPRWMVEGESIQIRVSDRRYFIIDEVDAARLEAIRKLVPLMIEERRKMTS